MALTKKSSFGGVIFAKTTKIRKTYTPIQSAISHYSLLLATSPSRRLIQQPSKFKCNDKILKHTNKGMAISKPITPHSQPQANIHNTTNKGFILNRRPNTVGVTNCDSIKFNAKKLPGTSSAILTDSYSKKPTPVRITHNNNGPI